MSNAPNHTSTPWSAHQQAIAGGCTHIAYIDTANGNAGLGEGEGEANAALIVRAVNSHAALVEALEIAEGFIDASGGHEHPDSGDEQNRRWLLETIRAALAKAK